MSEQQPPAIAGESAILIQDNVRERHYPVDSNFSGWRLDRFLSARLARLSRDKANEIAKHGDVTILPDRRKPKPSLKLQVGEVVVLREHLSPEWIQDAQVEVLYEDEDLVIVNKPAGMLVHESASVRLNTRGMGCSGSRRGCSSGELCGAAPSDAHRCTPTRSKTRAQRMW